MLMRMAAMLLCILPCAAAAQVPVPAETPMLAAQVAAGTLQPISGRLPQTPLIAPMDGPDTVPGRQGGTLRTLISNPREVRHMVVFGYARLVGHDRALNLGPDILLRVENIDDRIFTLHLRPGHKWSDGHPFTSEDFRYFWEDVANNPELSPNGPGTAFLVDGVPPKVEFPDALRVRYSWPKPNPKFLALQAGASPLFIYRPAHYLKKFHRRYGDPAWLEAQVQAAKVRNWAGLHNRLDNMYNFDNADLPSLQPWINTTPSPASRYVFQRNPYYHRIDPMGRQLPYIDTVIMHVAEARLIPAKSMAGETDLQARGLSFSDITALKKGEQQGGYATRLWPGAPGAHIALYPNLNYERPQFQKLFRDVRFRRALSMGIDRHLINRSLYFGMASESNNMVLPQSELYSPHLAQSWAMHDPVQANQLLDSMGLLKRDANGVRLLPDGSRLELIVETADQSSEQSDVLQLIAMDWRRIGVELFIKPADRDTLRARAYAGRSMMTVWSGFDTGIPTPDMSPDELAPVTQDQLQWPIWGQHYQTGGNTGTAPDLAPARELLALLDEWRGADGARRREIWLEMLAIHADQQFSIGVISQVRQPVVVSRKLRNVPAQAHYGWNPGAFFGIYRPDQFWFEAPGEPGPEQ